MNNLDQIKNLYEKGYRCIKTEQNPSSSMTVYLKNFEVEYSKEIIVYGQDEINEITNFITNQSLS